jgi:hypothetical protein
LKSSTSTQAEQRATSSARKQPSSGPSSRLVTNQHLQTDSGKHAYWASQATNPNRSHRLHHTPADTSCKTLRQHTYYVTRHTPATSIHRASGSCGPSWSTSNLQGRNAPTDSTHTLCTGHTGMSGHLDRKACRKKASRSRWTDRLYALPSQEAHQRGGSGLRQCTTSTAT